MGTALVTGGAGFIGSYITDELLRRGYAVRILDNLEPQVHGGLRENGGRPDYLAREAELVLGDVRDPEAVRNALHGVDVLVHQAALVGVPQSMYDIRRYTDINAMGGATVLDVAMNDRAIRDRLQKMVVASSMSIYGEGAYRCPDHGTVFPKLRPLAQLQAHGWAMRCPATGCDHVVAAVATDESKPLQPLSIYAIGKRDHEEMFLGVGRAYGIPTVALRYWQVYGQRQALSNPYTGVGAIFCSRVLAGNAPPVYEDGAQLRDFVHAKDIARANALALESADAIDHAINIGTGNPISIADVAWTIVREMGADRDGITPQVLQQFRPGDTRDCFPDISAARRLLGYAPTIPFTEGAKELVAWVREQKGRAEDRFEQAQLELQAKGLGSASS
ncbi:MAG: NAD-dependent epimerase/dehydratase family protein [Chloroflexi bacterium]|nr:NAD-dependent epimerase/dehydratase family protein [Chloroflexota bacterium]